MGMERVGKEDTEWIPKTQDDRIDRWLERDVVAEL
jgi:hypothetical protein